MKLGIILNTNDAEEVWNCLRFGNTALKEKHSVKIFLLGKGVELEDIKNRKYNINKQIGLFIKNKGRIFACETCLKSRGKKSSDICPISTMKDLLKLVEESDKILTFG